MSAAAITMTAGPVLPGVEQVRAEPIGGGRVRVGWAGSNASAGVRLERSVDGGQTWREVARLAGTVSWYVDRVAPDTLYAYRARTFRGALSSAFSEPAWVRTPPAEVAAVRVEEVRADGFRVRWEPSPGATVYELELAAAGEGFRTVLQVGGGTLSARLDGLQPGRRYAVRVVAVGVGGAAEASREWRVTTLPAATASVRAERLSETSVRVSFEAVVGATGYVLEREGAGRPFGRLASLKAGQTDYVDVQVLPTESYSYRVIAINESGESEASGVASVLPSGGALSSWPRQVVRLALTAGRGESEAQAGVAVVRWNLASEPGYEAAVEGYRVERRVGRAWRLLGLTRGDAEEFAVRDLRPGEGAWVRVLPLLAGAWGEPSEAVWVRAAPASPTGLRLLTAPTASAVTLMWTAPRGALRYTLERSADGVMWSVVGSDFPVAAYVDGTVQGGRRYGYRVTSHNEGGSSRPSSVFWVTTPPARPAAVRVATLTDGRLRVSWQDAEGERFYRVETSRDGVVWRPAARAMADSESAVVVGRGMRWVRVAAVNQAGPGLFSVAPVVDA